MNRRTFLTRSGLALGALIVGDEVLEAMERLAHRKVFPSAALRPLTLVDIAKRYPRHEVNRAIRDLMPHHPLLMDIPWKVA